MHGFENGRPAAKYAADRALFMMLLAAPYGPAGRASATARSLLGDSRIKMAAAAQDA
ncbi:hypothetical protein ACVWXL_005371 [Bradyrhizobium sp. GM22.5]